MSEPINRLTFDAAELVLDHPPRWRDPNKLAVYQIATSSGPFKGTIKFARWPEQPLPEMVKDAWEVSIVPGLFEYPSLDHPGRVDWYMNFADRNVFVAYGTSLLAQDELQVAEHPALASIREVLVAQGQPAATLDGEGRPTPITISGVQRRCVIDTLPNRAEG